MTTIRKVLVTGVLTLSLAMVVMGVGCAAMSSYITPATRDKRAIAYVEKQGVADANDYSGYFNLEKAERLARDLTAANAVRVQAIQHMYEDNELLVAQLQGSVTRNLEMARAREEFLFSEDGGLLSMGLTAAGLGTFTGLLGLMRKRPGDLTKEDVEKAIADFRQEAGIKAEQFAQVVTGVEKFFKSKDQLASLVNDKDKPALEKVDAILAVLKTQLGKEQDIKTRQEVAKVKATV